MPKTLTLFEHEYTSGFNWTDSELSALERMNGGAGSVILRPTLRAGKRELQAAQHVGVVRVGSRTVQILPKIHRPGGASPEERSNEATHNLLHLLAYAGQLSVREHETASLLRHNDDWFEILTRLFASHLLDEWQRGAYRNYQVVEADSPVLKGKWRIGEQLRRPHRKHVFSIAYDEFTADNPLNRVFRFVVERLWRLSRNGTNRRMLGNLRQWMEEVTLRPGMTVAEASGTTLTRLNRRFEQLLNLALLFLEGGALQMKAGDMSTFAFTFDMNKLFESFVVNFIRSHREEILPPALRACELLPQSNGATHYLAHSNDRHVFLLKPDLVFRQGGEFPLLVDAKYKRLDGANSRLGVSEADFYQMNAYAHRYGCDRVVLLYPQTAGMPNPLRAKFEVEGTNISIVAATINLQIALAHKRGKESLIDELNNIFGEDGYDGRGRADIYTAAASA
jgi:5-methylcytosine-specific restriction enzyme subunit McrC